MLKRILTLILILGMGVLCAEAQLTMKKTADGILITEAGEPVLQYHTVPKNNNGEYQRMNYIHPLYSLRGKVLTEDFPADHPHQRGVFWGWNQVWIGDQHIADGWLLEHFEQSLAELEFMKSNNGIVTMKTEVDWMSDRWMPAGVKEPYLKERGTFTVYPREGNTRRIDFEISLRALTEGVKLGGSDNEKGYGGFSARLNLPDHVVFSGPEGKISTPETAVVSEGFVNIAGKFDSGKREGGVAIIDHPGNPGYPQTWILREKKGMQNAVWPGREAVSISTSDPLVLRYTLLVYSGKLSSRKIERIAGSLEN